MKCGLFRGGIHQSVNAGVSNSNYPGADEHPVWSLGGQIFLICWLAYHNTVDTTFELANLPCVISGTMVSVVE